MGSGGTIQTFRCDIEGTIGVQGRNTLAQVFLDKLLAKANATSAKLVALKQKRQRIDGMVSAWGTRSLVCLQERRVETVQRPPASGVAGTEASVAMSAISSAVHSYLDEAASQSGERSTLSSPFQPVVYWFRFTLATAGRATRMLHVVSRLFCIPPCCC